MKVESQQKLDTLKAELDKLRPLRPEHVAALKDYFKIGLTYTSNALEGNRLTETETKLVIEDGLTIGGKPLKDHLEAVGHADAKEAGRYRSVPVFITGSRHLPPAAAQVPVRMRTFCKTSSGKRKQLHPVDFAAWLHFRLVNIHPFIDGNGRTARLIMNVAVLQDGYPVVIIPPILRREYLDTLESCHGMRREPEPFFNFVARAAIESLREYLRLLRSE